MKAKMRKFLLLIVAAAQTACVVQEPAIGTIETTPYSLSSADLNVIRNTVAAETLIPDRARVTDVAASVTRQGVILACGYVSGIEISGIYGPGRAFSGVLADNVAGTRVFAITGRIAQTSTDQIVTHRLCEKDGIALGSVSAMPSNDKIKTLIGRARDLDRRCRGTEGANPSSSVCDERNTAFKDLNENGWCYGKAGQVGYQNEWHKCEASSIHLD